MSATSFLVNHANINRKAQRNKLTVDVVDDAATWDDSRAKITGDGNYADLIRLDPVHEEEKQCDDASRSINERKK